MLMVCGPRLSTEAFPDVAGLEKHGYVGDLLEHFADTTPADLASALERALRRTRPRYRALRRDGARQAADRIARLIT
jgi:hypothetical protein